MYVNCVVTHKSYTCMYSEWRISASFYTIVLSLLSCILDACNIFNQSILHSGWRLSLEACSTCRLLNVECMRVRVG